MPVARRNAPDDAIGSVSERAADCGDYCVLIGGVTANRGQRGGVPGAYQNDAGESYLRPLGKRQTDLGRRDYVRRARGGFAAEQAGVRPECCRDQQ